MVVKSFVDIVFFGVVCFSVMRKDLISVLFSNRIKGYNFCVPSFGSQWQPNYSLTPVEGNF